MERSRAYIIYYFKIQFDGEEIYAAQEVTMAIGGPDGNGVNLRNQVDGFRTMIAETIGIPVEDIAVVSKEEYDLRGEE